MQVEVQSQTEVEQPSEEDRAGGGATMKNVWCVHETTYHQSAERSSSWYFFGGGACQILAVCVCVSVVLPL